MSPPFEGPSSLSPYILFAQQDQPHATVWAYYGQATRKAKLLSCIKQTYIQTNLSLTWTDKFRFSDLAPSGVHYHHRLLCNRPIVAQSTDRCTIGGSVECTAQLANSAMQSPDHANWSSVHNIYTHLTALCPGLPGWTGTRKVYPI